MKKRVKYCMFLLLLFAAAPTAIKASSGSDTGIAAAPDVVETPHATSLHVAHLAYLANILHLPSAVFLHATTSPALSSELVTGEREMLFAPPFEPPTTGTGGTGAVGEAPTGDGVWVVVLISLGYMVWGAARRSSSLSSSPPAPLHFGEGRPSTGSGTGLSNWQKRDGNGRGRARPYPTGGQGQALPLHVTPAKDALPTRTACPDIPLKRGWTAAGRTGVFTLLSEKLPKRESEAIEQVLFGQKPFFCFFFCGHKKRKGNKNNTIQ